MTDIVITSRDIKLSKVEESFLKDKIKKHSKLLEKATAINVVITYNKSHSREDKRLKLEIMVTMPQTFIKVEDKGFEFDKLVDQLEVTLKRRLKRYSDQFTKWESTKPWKFSEIKKENDTYQNSLFLDDYKDYVPTIKRKVYDDEKPLHPAEAVERMELLGHNSFLIKQLLLMIGFDNKKL